MQKFFSYTILVVIVLSFSCINSTFLSAQCTINQLDGETNLIGIPPDSPIRAAQSFTACQDGQITTISLNLAGTFTGTFDLYLGIHPGNSDQLTSAPIATTTSDGISPVITFDIPTPFPVSDDGTLYIFEVDLRSNSGIDFGWVVSLTNTSDYPDGEAFRFNDRDLDFEIEIAPIAIMNPVPTMSQWGLIIFGLLIVNLSLIFQLQLYPKQLREIS